MKIVLLGNRHGWHTRQLEQAGKAIGIDVTTKSYDELSAGFLSRTPLTDSCPEFVRESAGFLLRAMGPATLQQIVFRMDLLNQLNRFQVRMINSPKSIEWSIDKFLSLALLKNCDLPIPDTEVIQCPIDNDGLLQIDQVSPRVDRLLKAWGKVVLKPLFGSEGRGLKLFDSLSSFVEYLELLNQDAALAEDKKRLGNVLYLQRFLPHEFDVRILVVGPQAYAIERRQPTGWISNISQGAEVQVCEMTETMRQLAMRAAKAVQGEVVGVDLMPVGEDWKILEVNGAPGWKGIQKAYPAMSIATEVLKLFQE